MAKQGTAKSDWAVAFHRDTGDHIPWDYYYGGADSPYHYEPATYEFTDTLEVRSYDRGRSSVTVQLADSQARLHHMSFAEFMRLVPHMNGGRIAGTWGYSKNGSNTSIIRVS